MLYVYYVGGDDEEKIEGMVEGLVGYLVWWIGRKIEVWMMDRWFEEVRVRGLGDVIVGYFEEGWGEGRRMLVLFCLVIE